MPRLTHLPTFDQKSGDLYVVIETPQGSRNKNKYDDDLRAFQMGSLLPVGMAFPYDFGFVPSTLGEDGDPLDVLVLMEQPAPGGFVVPARLVGVIEAEQSEDGRTERNDRLIAVASGSTRYKSVQDLNGLGEELLREIELFFTTYNELKGKQFKPIGRHGPSKARRLVENGEDEFRRKKAKKPKTKK
jgi:inorganic pyrophosphatase